MKWTSSPLLPSECQTVLAGTVKGNKKQPEEKILRAVRLLIYYVLDERNG